MISFSLESFSSYIFFKYTNFVEPPEPLKPNSMITDTNLAAAAAPAATNAATQVAPLAVYHAVLLAMTPEEREFFAILTNDTMRLSYIATVMKKSVPAGGMAGRPKLEVKPPQKYDGCRDRSTIHNFIYQVKQYYLSTEATPAQIQGTFHERLIGDALTWFRLRLQTIPLSEVSLKDEWSLDKTCEALVRDFEPQDRDKSAYKQLCSMKLLPNSPLGKFVNRFQACALNVRIENPAVTDAEICNRFREKLDGYEEGFIAYPDADLDSLEKLIKVAFDFDKVLKTRASATPGPARRSFNPTRRFESNVPSIKTYRDDPMDVDVNKLSVPAKRTLEKQGINTNLKAKMSDDDRQKHLREGLCFRCHEQGHISSACPHFRRN